MSSETFFGETFFVETERPVLGRFLVMLGRGARDQGDAWFFDKPVKNDLRPTMKPVARRPSSTTD